jgi:hypothetical protein
MKYLGIEIDEKLNFKHNTKENGKESWLPWENTTKTHQNCNDNSIISPHQGWKEIFYSRKLIISYRLSKPD